MTEKIRRGVPMQHYGSTIEAGRVSPAQSQSSPSIHLSLSAREVPFEMRGQDRLEQLVYLLVDLVACRGRCDTMALASSNLGDRVQEYVRTYSTAIFMAASFWMPELAMRRYRLLRIG